MYIPEAFRETRTEVLHDAIDACGLALFVTIGDRVPVATQLPMLLDRQEGELGTLYGHLARANAQWLETRAGSRALAVFPGPDGYVSPSWYASKAQHGRVVPTWNYVTVQAEGEAEFFEDPDRLHALVTRLTRKHEKRRVRPWQVSDAPPDYIAGQLGAIIGVRLPVGKLAGSWKLGQHKSEADKAGMLAGYAAEGSQYDALAKASREAFSKD